MDQNLKIRVNYSDTDAGGVVYYGKYLTWFEIGRTEFLREHGCSFNDYVKKGFLCPVVHVEVDYKGKVEYDDEIVVETKLGKIGNSSVEFLYRVLNKGKEVVSGKTVNVFLKEWKPVNVPDEIRKLRK